MKKPKNRNASKETGYLLSSKKNKERLFESIAQLKDNNIKKVPLSRTLDI